MRVDRSPSEPEENRGCSTSVSTSRSTIVARQLGSVGFGLSVSRDARRGSSTYGFTVPSRFNSSNQFSTTLIELRSTGTPADTVSSDTVRVSTNSLPSGVMS